MAADRLWQHLSDPDKFKFGGKIADHCAELAGGQSWHRLSLSRVLTPQLYRAAPRGAASVPRPQGLGVLVPVSISYSNFIVIIICDCPCVGLYGDVVVLNRGPAGLQHCIYSPSGPCST